MKGSCSWKFWSIEGLLKQKIPCKIYPAKYHESVLLYESNHAKVDKIDRIMERLGNLCSRLSKETKTTTAICNGDKPV